LTKYTLSISGHFVKKISPEFL